MENNADNESGQKASPKGTFINHVAIWTKDLERLKEFYITYFNGSSNTKYINEKKGFESYFISFDSGARLELMTMASIPDNKNALSSQYTGIIHLCFSVGTKEAVITLTETLERDGYTITSPCRTTGDGYFESQIADPDGNLIEITV